MKNKKVFLLSSGICLAASSFAFVLCSNQNANKFKVNATPCSHEGHHYDAVNATSQAHGHDEFWTCCKCHETFLEEPESGTWDDAGEYVGGVPENVPVRHYADKIGNCTICDDLMSISDVDFISNKYGAAMYNSENSDVSDWDNGYNGGNKLSAANAKTLVYSTYGWDPIKIQLPKIQYNKYGTLKFDISIETTSDWTGNTSYNSCGFNTSEIDRENNAYSLTSSGSLTINSANSSYTATLKIGNVTRFLNITSDDVLNGNEALSFYVQGATNSGSACYFLNLSSLNCLCAEHTFTDCKIPTNKISYKTETCSICGTVIIEPMTSSDVVYKARDYSINDNYGTTKTLISGSDLEDGGGLYVFNNDGETPDKGSMVSKGNTGNLIKYALQATDGGYSAWIKCGLPKVNYAIYDNVTFKYFINSGSYYIGNSTENYLTVNGGSGAYGYISVNNYNGALEVSIIPIDNYLKAALTYTITDGDIISGNACLDICLSADAWRNFYLFTPTLTVGGSMFDGLTEIENTCALTDASNGNDFIDKTVYTKSSCSHANSIGNFPTSSLNNYSEVRLFVRVDNDNYNYELCSGSGNKRQISNVWYEYKFDITNKKVYMKFAFEDDSAFIETNAGEAGFNEIKFYNFNDGASSNFTVSCTNFFTVDAE